MIIFTQRIVNKLSFGTISLDLTCFYLGGWDKYSSIAGFGRCRMLCHSERMRRIAISRQYCPVGLEFQNTFTPVIASGSEAIYCLKKITSHPSLPSHLITQSLSHFSSNRGAAA